MSASWQPTGHRPARWPALAAYVVAWLVIGGVLAGTVIALLSGADDDVALPPVQATELARAADGAGCRLRRGAQATTTAPAVEGPPAAPLPAGRYTTEQPAARLVGAMRRGTVVLRYRPDAGDDAREALEELQAGVPRATILVPDGEMPYRFAATAWRRKLGCARLDARAVDAIRLFRGRYVGQGPDAPG